MDVEKLRMLRGLRQHLKRGYRLCVIYKRVQIIKSLSETALHNVSKISPNSTIHKIEQFYKGIWGISLPLHCLAVADTATLLFLYVGDHVSRLL